MKRGAWSTTILVTHPLPRVGGKPPAATDANNPRATRNPQSPYTPRVNPIHHNTHLSTKYPLRKTVGKVNYNLKND